MVASPHMRKVYDTAAWRKARLQFIEMMGWQCQVMEWSAFHGRHIRCQVRDKRVGGSESLTVDHTNQQADPMDSRFWKVMCHRHHGQKDGGRAGRGRRS